MGISWGFIEDLLKILWDSMRSNDAQPLVVSTVASG